MDPKDKGVDVEGSNNLGASSEDDLDTYVVLRGGPDPIAFENWVQEIKEMMIVPCCIDEQKILYALFKMMGERPVPVPPSWARFKELFFDRYFPSFTHEDKVGEFTSLTQGSMTIGEYATKFVELSCFTLYMIPDEVRKEKRFEKDLQRRMLEQVVVFQVHNFSDLVDKASVLEKSL
ncbi:uncharacterized protein LOC131148215 [Malania oleifera]|uniref:uncharacterized protein LOC131148215 n=1 Tax=Malania oleifera TaxID=397392 RepID=UPI0025ADC0ED|nr:uncharacterized protein LOC131148215 [Malania oleifera]